MKNQEYKQITRQTPVKAISIVCYDEQLPEGWDIVKERIKIIDRKTSMTILAIRHNKDTSKLHYHFVIFVTKPDGGNRQMHVSTILNILGIKFRNEIDDELFARNIQYLKMPYIQVQVLYLLHMSENARKEGKAVYPVDELVSNLNYETIIQCVKTKEWANYANEREIKNAIIEYIKSRMDLALEILKLMGIFTVETSGIDNYFFLDAKSKETLFKFIFSENSFGNYKYIKSNLFSFYLHNDTHIEFKNNFLQIIQQFIKCEVLISADEKTVALVQEDNTILPISEDSQEMKALASIVSKGVKQAIKDQVKTHFGFAKKLLVNNANLHANECITKYQKYEDELWGILSEEHELWIQKNGKNVGFDNIEFFNVSIINEETEKELFLTIFDEECNLQNIDYYDILQKRRVSVSVREFKDTFKKQIENMSKTRIIECTYKKENSSKIEQAYAYEEDGELMPITENAVEIIHQFSEWSKDFKNEPDSNNSEKEYTQQVYEENSADDGSTLSTEFDFENEDFNYVSGEKINDIRQNNFQETGINGFNVNINYDDFDDDIFK